MYVFHLLISHTVLEMLSQMARANMKADVSVRHFFVGISSLLMTFHVTPLIISFFIYKIGVKLATL